MTQGVGPEFKPQYHKKKEKEKKKSGRPQNCLGYQVLDPGPDLPALATNSGPCLIPIFPDPKELKV
jgi:hypothetical protein